jgi:Flp pilus assembly protein TadD
VKETFSAIDGKYADDPLRSGYSLLDRGKTAEAGAEFDRAMRQQPGDPEPHYEKGVILVHQGKRVEAAFEFQNAIRIRPYGPAYDYLAFLALEKGDWGGAVEYASKVIELDPTFDHGHAYGLRADAYAHLDKKFEAYPDAVRGCEFGDRHACSVKAYLGR